MSTATADDLIYISKGPEKDKYHLRTLLSIGKLSRRPGPSCCWTAWKTSRATFAADIDHDGRLDAMILPAYGSIMLVRQAEEGKFTQVTDRNMQTGLVANVEPKLLSLARWGGRQPAAL